MARIVALCGASQVGKTTVALLFKRLGWHHVSTSLLLRALLLAKTGKEEPTHDELFEAGTPGLDVERPAWIFDGQDLNSGQTRLLIDSLRSSGQADVVHDAGGFVVCIGEDAYNIGEGIDLHIPRWSPKRIVSAILQQANDQFEQPQGTITGVVGAQWGSEGKGKVCSWIVANRLVPFAAMARSGGPNAGHRVECPDGEYVIFRHLPSATPWAAPGTDLLIGPGAVVDAAVLARELPHVPEGCQVIIDPSVALVDEHAKQLEQDYTLSSIGSTLTGTGGAMALRVLRVADTFGKCKNDLPDLPGVKVAPTGALLRGLLRSGHDVLIEATQGLGLSLLGGGYPHTTSRDTGPCGLLSDLGIGVGWDVDWWLVARTYPIRVAGPSGPMERETTWEEVSRTSGTPADTLRKRETTTVTKRLRRVASWVPGYLTEVASLFATPPRVFLSFGDYFRQVPGEFDLIREDCLLVDPGAVVGDGPGAQEAVQLEGWSP